MTSSPDWAAGLVRRLVRDEGGMTRIFGYHLSIEMLLLWLIESSICFVLLYWLLSDGLALTAPAGDAARGSAAVLALTIGMVSFALGLYRPETCIETRRLLVKTLVSAGLALPVVWLVGHAVRLDPGALLGWDTVWPLQLLLIWTALLLATRLLFGLAVRHGWFTRRVLLVGDEQEIARTAEAIGRLRRGQFRVAGAQAASGLSAEPTAGRPRIWAVIAGPASAATGVLRDWQQSGVRVIGEAAFWECHLGRIELADAAATALPARAGTASEALRRGFDILFAGLLLAFTAPLMLLTAVLIKLDSPGPVFYRQERVGLGGQSFTLIKFRSMRADAERNGPVWAAAGDARVTRVGAFIRKMRIDELPQLFNILRGEMSLVGPRPERPHFADQIALAVPGYRERSRVKPGLTGWAQVNFPYGASIEDARVKLSYDLYYVRNRSLFLDLMILFATVRVVLFQEGAR